MVTTFVAQSSQALNPDYAQITASLVYELVLMQRAARAGTSGVSASSLNLASRTSQTTDLWVNGLWLVSLMTALLTALVSVLAKQWIQVRVSRQTSVHESDSTSSSITTHCPGEHLATVLIFGNSACKASSDGESKKSSDFSPFFSPWLYYCSSLASLSTWHQ